MKLSKVLIFVSFLNIHFLKAEITTGYFEGSFIRKSFGKNVDTTEREVPAHVYIREIIKNTETISQSKTEKDYIGFVYVEKSGSVGASAALFKVEEIRPGIQAWQILSQKEGTEYLAVQEDLKTAVTYVGKMRSENGENILELDLHEDVKNNYTEDKSLVSLVSSGSFIKSPYREWLDLCDKELSAEEISEDYRINVNLKNETLSGELRGSKNTQCHLKALFKGLYTLKTEKVSLSSVSGTQQNNGIRSVLIPLYKNRCFLVGDVVRLCVFSPVSGEANWPLSPTADLYQVEDFRDVFEGK